MEAGINTGSTALHALSKHLPSCSQTTKLSSTCLVSSSSTRVPPVRAAYLANGATASGRPLTDIIYGSHFREIDIRSSSAIHPQFRPYFGEKANKLIIFHPFLL
jgi:hypothetical protein